MCTHIVSEPRQKFCGFGLLIHFNTFMLHGYAPNNKLFSHLTPTKVMTRITIHDTFTGNTFVGRGDGSVLLLLEVVLVEENDALLVVVVAKPKHSKLISLVLRLDWLKRGIQLIQMHG